MSDQKLTVLGHLAELRGRLTRSLIVVIIGTVVSFVFASQLFKILKSPAGDVTFIYTEVSEMVGTYMRVSLAGGLVIAIPYIIFETVMFISPALTRREKKYIYLILPWVSLMFIGGVVFGYFILLPPATNFLLNFGNEIAIPQIKIGNYISFITRLLLAIGLVFELPVLTTFLARLGLVKPKWLASKRKVAIIGAFLLSAVITPTIDPINQSLVAAPLIVLYELSIWLARLVQPREVTESLQHTPLAEVNPSRSHQG